MILEKPIILDKYSELTKHFSPYQYSADQANQWAMEFIGQQFKTSHRSLPRNSNLWVEVDNTEIKSVKKIKINKWVQI